MANFNFVTSRLATGGAIKNAADVDALSKAGITAIINCRNGQNDANLLAGKFAYLWNPTADDGQHKPPEWFGRSLDFALPLFGKPRQKIYAHCAEGINRGPSTAYAILRALGLSGLEAQAMIRLARPIAFIAYAHDADDAIKKLGYA